MGAFSRSFCHELPYNCVMKLLDLPLILEIRRNHALEHATLHILGRQFPRQRLAGHSNPTGFIVLGDVPTAAIRQAVVQALTRLQSGERELAIHPGCGTNYVISGLVAGLLAWLSMGNARNGRQRLSRLPFVVMLATLGFIISQPLGPIFQARLTTEANPADLTIVDIYPLWAGVHRVVTRG